MKSFLFLAFAALVVASMPKAAHAQPAPGMGRPGFGQGGPGFGPGGQHPDWRPNCDGRFGDPQWSENNHDWRVAQFIEHQRAEREQFEMFEKVRFQREQAAAAQAERDRQAREAAAAVAAQAERDRIAREQAAAAAALAAQRAAECTQSTSNLTNAQNALNVATFQANNNGCGHDDNCHAMLWAQVARSLTAVQAAQADKTAKCGQ